MPKQRLCSFVISAYACWLVLLASGDDLNFARILLSPTDSPLEDMMTLDDPNADFIESDTQPNVAQGLSTDGRRLLRTSASHTSRTANGFLPSRERQIPLRC